MNGALPYIVLALVGMFALFAIFVVMYKKKKGIDHEPDYRTFSIMGLIWLIIGLGSMAISGEGFSPLFSMGLIFFIIGLANRNKWKKSKKLTQNQLLTLVVLVAITVGLVTVTYLTSTGIII